MRKLYVLLAALIFLAGSVSALTIDIDIFSFGSGERDSSQSTADPGQDSYNDPSINRSAPKHETRIDSSSPITVENEKQGFFSGIKSFLSGLLAQ
ncbi:MAG: hypothetical protein ABEJ75_00455 [Candidatus Nanohaloarchaea archaeon]